MPRLCPPSDGLSADSQLASTVARCSGQSTSPRPADSGGIQAGGVADPASWIQPAGSVRPTLAVPSIAVNQRNEVAITKERCAWTT